MDEQGGVGERAIKKEIPWWRAEWPLAVSILTVASIAWIGHAYLDQLGHPGMLALFFTWLFVAILISAMAVVKHADALAVRLGEPYGTLILTLAVTGMEVMMICALTLQDETPETLARDTMFSVVMIVLNGLVGAALLLGGWRHKEQFFNLQGANSFLSLILPLSVVGLVLPSFTVTTAGPTFSKIQAFAVVVSCFCIYAVFLITQTLRHRAYFAEPGNPTGEPVAGHHESDRYPTWVHAVLLVALLAPVVFLSEQLAVVLDHGTDVFHLPKALSGLFVAILILTPEGLSAVKAAMRNELQRSINILLGSVLATISLTIPSVLAIGLISGKEIVLGLGPLSITLLALTLGTCVLNFAHGRTNILMGAVHMLLFIIFLLLIFEG